jgi:hypothetical protein
VATRYRPLATVRGDLLPLFPNLSLSDWHVKSPWCDDYQCIAWATSRTDRHMWPHIDYWWFPGAPVAMDAEQTALGYFLEGFKKIGYVACDKDDFEIGYQKVAIYANSAGVTHMARQHCLGRGWLSKLGVLEDISHRRLEDLEGDVSPMANQYGKVVQILKRDWWTALFHLHFLHCSWGAVRWWFYRLVHPSWQ